MNSTLKCILHAVSCTCQNSSKYQLFHHPITAHHSILTENITMNSRRDHPHRRRQTWGGYEKQPSLFLEILDINVLEVNVMIIDRITYYETHTKRNNVWYLNCLLSTGGTDPVQPRMKQRTRDTIRTTTVKWKRRNLLPRTDTHDDLI